MTKRPSNMLFNVVIAVAAILGFFVLGSWLIQLWPDADENDVTRHRSQARAVIPPELFVS